MGRNLLENLESLCRIRCSEEDKKLLMKNLKNTLEFIEIMNEINTENTSPCDSVLEELQCNVMREDDIGECLPTEKFLSNAPDHIGTMIKVPKIIN